MIYQTNKGERIKAKEGKSPEWSEYHQSWYVWGYRFIKTKQTFSKNCLLHNGKKMEKVDA
jgi:hypothetical protein